MLSYRDNAEMLLVLAQDRNSSGDEAGAQRYAMDACEKADKAMAYLAGMYTEAGMTMEGYTPTATVPQSSTGVSASTSQQTLSVPGYMDSEQSGGIQGVDIEGTVGFFQIILDGFTGFIDFIQDAGEAFSKIGN